MSKESIATLFMDLRASAGNLTKDVDKAMGKARKRLNAHGKTMGLALSAGFAASAATLTIMTKKGLEQADVLAKTADSLAINTQALQAYRHQAELTGVGSATLEKGLEKLAKNSGDFANGMVSAASPVAKSFEKIGISMADVQSMNAEQTFEAVVAGINKIEDPATRASVSAALLGKSGQKMANFFIAGADGVNAAKKEIDELGLGISRLDAAKVEQANDAMHRFQSITGQTSQRLAIEMAPIIQGISEELLGAAKEAGGMNNIIRKGIDVGVSGAGYLIDAWGGLKLTFKALQFGFAKTVEGVTTGVIAIGEGANNVIFLFNDLGKAVSKGVNAGIGGAETLINGFLSGTTTAITSTVQIALDGIEGMVNKSIDAVNWLREKVGADKIGRVDLGDDLKFEAPKIEFGRTSFDPFEEMDLSGLKGFKEASAKVANDIHAEIMAMPDEQFSSDKLKAKVAEWRAASEETAKIAADAAEKRKNTTQELTNHLKKEENKRVKSAKTAADKTAQAWGKSSKQVSDNFADAFLDGITGASDFGESVKGIIKDIGSQFIKSNISGLFQNILGGIGGGGGAQGGGGTAGVLGGIIKGFFADGGRPPSGQVSVVGERGAELFVPDRPGTIIPNHLLGGAPASQSAPVINVNQTFTAGVTHAELSAALPTLKADTMQGVLDAVARGGAFRRQLQA